MIDEPKQDVVKMCEDLLAALKGEESSEPIDDLEAKMTGMNSQMGKPL